jgi:hypothetical protein
LTTPSRRAQKGRPGVRPRRIPPRQSFVERNRNRLLLGAGAVAVLVIGAFLFVGSPSTAAYSCSIRWAPPSPAPTTAPSATPRLGFLQDDMGHEHVGAGTAVKYTFCPPASGKHYNQAGVSGPINPKLYGPSDKTVPQNWVHNLEHGGLVLLYKCPGGDVTAGACSASGQQAMAALSTDFPNSPVCNIPPGNVGPVITRFDDMDFNYAALVWDNVLPMDTLDLAQVKAFFLQQAERLNPELLCARPSDTPGPTASPAPSASATPGSSAPAASVEPSQPAPSPS